METLKCDGSCEIHKGKVKQVSIDGWGTFMYCDEAIAEDKRRGFKVTINGTDPDPQSKTEQSYNEHLKNQ